MKEGLSMIMTESDYFAITEELLRMYRDKSSDYVDSLAVAYILFRRAEASTVAEQTLIEMKEAGVPEEWAFLVGGKPYKGKDLEKRLKSAIAESLSVKGTLFDLKLFRISLGLVKLAKNASNVVEASTAYKLMALYALTGRQQEYVFGLISDNAYNRLPHYVKWIEKYVW
jgi:hypothetical protein